MTPGTKRLQEMLAGHTFMDTERDKIAEKRAARMYKPGRIGRRKTAESTKLDAIIKRNIKMKSPQLQKLTGLSIFAIRNRRTRIKKEMKGDKT